MFDQSILLVFIPTFFGVSFLPGLCMTMAMTMGMSVGLRRSFYMMWGELFGVGLVATSAVLGISALMLNFPLVFTIFKLAGGGYLLFLGISMWRDQGSVDLDQSLHKMSATSRKTLMVQGFVTAISNPKGWAFMVSLLPPFINSSQPLVPQLSILLFLILLIEFVCLVIYASSGKTLRIFLEKSGYLCVMNKITGTLLVGLGIWLALE
ncbi:LysE family translocator [Desulfovermiculus halophilus]|jgi:threonine/homoserine/homoserine lactone efflux protein|uniref:LysE family translocator n=1 Tax=Desulfovermiculus halophilus TaxID=339722 RepID=UPI0004872E77|nr:LysE family translocator [Desulfovermiculus halophilus]